LYDLTQRVDCCSPDFAIRRLFFVQRRDCGRSGGVIEILVAERQAEA
jgi:hypothetical protein